MKRESTDRARRTPQLASVEILALAAALVSGPAYAQDKLLTASKPEGAPAATVAAAPDANTAMVEDLDEDLPSFPAPAPLTVCQTDVRLSGTMYDARHPERSFAMFHVRAERSGEVYRVGERVAAFAIVSVGERTVVLDDGKSGCYLKLAGAPAPAPRAPKPAKTKAPKKKEPAVSNAFSSAELDAGIRVVGDNKYEVKRELLDKVSERMQQLMQGTQWKNAHGYSGVTGVELTKLASGDLLERLGLKTGDELRTLNGLQLANLESALQARALMSSSPALSLLVQRDGAPTTLDYRVVP
jgi:general secretion pathway protein C